MPMYNSTKKYMNLAGYEIINAASGGNSLVIGYGQYEHGAKTYLEGGDICLRMQQNGNLCIQAGSKDSVETRFVLSKVSWTLSGSTAYRDTIESKGGFVLSANGGDNVLYLVGKSIWIDNATTIRGKLTVQDDIRLSFKSSSGTIPLVVKHKRRYYNRKLIKTIQREYQTGRRRCAGSKRSLRCTGVPVQLQARIQGQRIGQRDADRRYCRGSGQALPQRSDL